MIPSLLVILICMIVAFILSEVFRKMGLPRVVGQVTAGLLLGIPVMKQFLFSDDAMRILYFLANLGIILLFYYVGLETNFRTFTKNIKRSVIISLFNTTIPFLIGFLVMKFIFHLNTLPSVIIGVSLSVSAQSVSVDILEELKLLKSKIGGMIISAGAVDDIIELLLVTIVLSSFHFMVNDMSMTRLFIDILIFALFIIIMKVVVLPFVLKFFGREKSSTALFMGSMMIVLLIASLSEYLGIGGLIGAMIAGMIVRQTIYKDVEIPNWEEHEIAKSTHIIAFGFLIPLFFVWIGLNTDVLLLFQDAWLIIAFLLIATVCTVGGTVLAILVSGGSFREGHILGWGLNPKGDVELVIAALALNAALITQNIFTALVIMSLMTTIISPIVFKRLVTKHRNLH
jgi:Kef-type K+ transport system membrane component KefB